MARAVWNGSISFGLVSIGVRAHSAVSDHDVKFHQLDPEGSRIRYRKVSEATGQEVDKDDIQMGFEMSKGEYVTFAKNEINELRPKMTRTIDVEDFVGLDEIDPVYFNRTYWLAPSTEAAARPYRLLAAAMEDQRKVGIGTVVMRNKEYLAAIRPVDGHLAMSTMRFADELVPAADVFDEGSVGDDAAEPSKKELAMATQIIESLTTEWTPEQYRDTYTDELKAMIKEKSKGGTITVEDGPAAPSNVTDLMAALEASVKAAKKPRRAAAERATKSAKSA
ncbi:MAG: Ku protein [Acidimicrobiales bacterium]